MSRRLFAKEVPALHDLSWPGCTRWIHVYDKARATGASAAGGIKLANEWQASMDDVAPDLKEQLWARAATEVTPVVFQITKSAKTRELMLATAKQVFFSGLTHGYRMAKDVYQPK